MSDVAEKTLDIDDKQDVFEALFDARDKWEEIGGVLRMKESDLRVIKLEELGDCAKCLNRLVTKWLNDGRNCTWRVLTDALRNVTVNKPNLAQSISAADQRSHPASESRSPQLYYPSDRLYTPQARETGVARCSCFDLHQLHVPLRSLARGIRRHWRRPSCIRGPRPISATQNPDTRSK